MLTGRTLKTAVSGGLLALFFCFDAPVSGQSLKGLKVYSTAKK
jgi:hypothetical protein